MAGLGRGGRGFGLLQALSKKKKEEEAEQMEARAREQMRLLKLQEEEEEKKKEAERIEAEQYELMERQKLEKAAKEAELAKAAAAPPKSPKLPLRGLGRGGMLASLVKNKAGLPGKRISPTEQIHRISLTEQIHRISPTEPKQISPPAKELTVTPPEKPTKLPSKLFSMGRGCRLAKSSGERNSPSPPRVSPVVEVKKEEPVAVKKEESVKPVSPVPVKKEEPIAEEKTVKTSSIEKAADELKIEHILRQSPVRKVGDSGQQANFGTNYIKLKCKNKGVYQYVVHFDPPVDNQFTRVKLLYHCSEITGPVRLFDGHTLFLPILLKDKMTIIKARAKTDTSDVTLKIQLTKILPPEQIPPTVFNIIFKNIMKVLQMSRIGQHYFSPLRQIEVPKHSLQVWPGYTTAVHEFENGLYVVVDIAHKVLRSETCWHLMSTVHNNSRNIENFRENVFNAIIGNVVLTRYNNKTYRIDDIMWDENPMSEFSYHNGTKTTYYAYYKEHYNIEIKDLKQPLLLNRVKKSKATVGTAAAPSDKKQTEIICLIPELCFMTGMSDELRKDIHVKKELSQHTRLSPKDRVEQLNELIRNIKSNPEALKQITNWGLELDDDLSPAQGRVLPREKIIFARKEVETDFKCDWTRPAGNEVVVSAVDINNWLIVYPHQKEGIVEKFCKLSIDCSRRTGINLSMPVTIPLRDDRPDTYYNEIKKNLNEHIQMVVIIFNMISDSRYARVKRLCCIECPVPSQVICLKTINKADNVLRTVAQKIILQMNVKLGGELWRLSIPVKKAMIVGIDVYHKTEKKYKSLAGFVSSLNHDQTKWYSKVCFQMVGQELTDTLKIAFMQSLKKYQEVNNFLPDKIFIYRDGVSEGQLAHVAEHEVQQLRSCFANDYSPQIAVIVVQKRINTRIFAIQGRDAVNPPPGAVLDHSITSKDNFDFFLVSQHVGQGTVTPTHYIVAYDDTQMKPDHIQRLSYKMTHLYYNWSGTIRVPAPCQYAHKIAFLTGQYLQEEPSEALCNRLFYL